jgi:hypothetical protein
MVGVCSAAAMASCERFAPGGEYLTFAAPAKGHSNRADFDVLRIPGGKKTYTKYLH